MPAICNPDYENLRRIKSEHKQGRRQDREKRQQEESDQGTHNEEDEEDEQEDDDDDEEEDGIEGAEDDEEKHVTDGPSSSVRNHGALGGSSFEHSWTTRSPDPMTFDLTGNVQQHSTVFFSQQQAFPLDGARTDDLFLLLDSDSGSAGGRLSDPLPALIPPPGQEQISQLMPMVTIARRGLDQWSTLQHTLLALSGDIRMLDAVNHLLVLASQQISIWTRLSTQLEECVTLHNSSSTFLHRAWDVRFRVPASATVDIVVRRMDAIICYVSDHWYWSIGWAQKHRSRWRPC